MELFERNLTDLEEMESLESCACIIGPFFIVSD